MGKELKRVPLDFYWQLGETWEGYLNPHYCAKPCLACDETGNSPEAQALIDRWHGYDKPEKWIYTVQGQRHNDNAWCYHLDKEDVAALLEADCLWDFTRVPYNDEQRLLVFKQKQEGGSRWLPTSNGYVPTPELVNAWAIRGFGHDSTNRSVVIQAVLKKNGYEAACSVCHGEGNIWESPEEKARYDAWEKYEPPTGEGYQLWENTTEGSPVSPVFETLDDLCAWCAKYATTFAYNTATVEQWKSMLQKDFVHYEDANGNVFL